MRPEKHAVARITLQQVAAPELSHTLAEAGEAAGRRRAGAELHGRDWKRQEAEQHVDEVGARVGEKDAVPRAVHGELDLDAGHSSLAQHVLLPDPVAAAAVQETMVRSSVTLYASSAIGRRIQVMEKMTHRESGVLVKKRRIGNLKSLMVVPEYEETQRFWESANLPLRGP